MNYSLSILPIASDEIYKKAKEYADKFVDGDDDFLAAVESTIERIGQMPGRGSRKHEKDRDVRGLRIEAVKGSFAYARKFPFLLIYKVYEEEEKVIIFQLWPETSDEEIRQPPDS